MPLASITATEPAMPARSGLRSKTVLRLGSRPSSKSRLSCISTPSAERSVRLVCSAKARDRLETLRSALAM
jgi:hypothetical protein